MQSFQTTVGAPAATFAPPRRVTGSDRFRARAVDGLLVAVALAMLAGLFVKWHNTSHDWLVADAAISCPKVPGYWSQLQPNAALLKGIRECAPHATDRFASMVRSAPSGTVVVFLLAFAAVAVAQMFLVVGGGATIGQRTARLRHPGRCSAAHAALVVVWRQAPVLVAGMMLVASRSITAACVSGAAVAVVQLVDPARTVSDRVAGPVVSVPAPAWRPAPPAWPAPTEH